LKYLVGSVLNPQNVKLLNPSAVLNGLNWQDQEPFGHPSHPNLLETTLSWYGRGCNPASAWQGAGFILIQLTGGILCAF